MGADGKRESSPKVYHGGGLAAAAARFPDARLPWLDLSTGINPAAYPVGEVPEQAWIRLPDPADIAALEAAAAMAYDAPDPAMVVAAQGAQALIQLLPRLFPARRVGILGFTYAEHEARWRAAGAAVETVERLELLGGFDVAVVVNPNNPDGRLTSPKELAGLAAVNGTLIVDEAFMDAVELPASLAAAAPGNAVVLRSFGKLYGLAGLRLGFAVAAPAVTGAIRDALGPWAVSGAAIDIGRRALADSGWRERTLARLAADAARLDALLTGAGFVIVGGTALFRLARHTDASAWFAHLGRAGILTRPFPARADWLRFGLPGNEVEWKRLEGALHGMSFPAEREARGEGKRSSAADDVDFLPSSRSGARRE